MAILRGEIYFVKLGPTLGRELDDKKRPVLVLSINDFNAKPLVVTVVPGKTLRPGKRTFRNEVVVAPSPTNGLTNLTVFQCLQIKSIDHRRFDSAPAGQISAEDLRKIEETLKLCLGLP